MSNIARINKWTVWTIHLISERVIHHFWIKITINYSPGKITITTLRMGPTRRRKARKRKRTQWIVLFRVSKTQVVVKIHFRIPKQILEAVARRSPACRKVRACLTSSKKTFCHHLVEKTRRWRTCPISRTRTSTMTSQKQKPCSKK